MGTLKWAKELAKKGGSKIADIQKKKELSKKLKPKDSLTTREKKAKKAWDDSVTASHDRRHKFKEDQVRRIKKEAWQDKKIAKGKSADASDYDKHMKRRVDEQLEQQIKDRQYLKGK